MHTVYDPIIRDIPGYPNYQISEDGIVYNKKTGREIKTSCNGWGYKQFTVIHCNEKKWLKIHRLLAQIFIPNKLNKPFVDHINRNKTDNNLSNLRWVSESENSTNMGITTNNTSGEKGVSKINDNGIPKWRAYIMKNYKKRTKRFPHTDEGFKQAVEWRKKMEAELHTYT